MAENGDSFASGNGDARLTLVNFIGADIALPGDPHCPDCAQQVCSFTCCSPSQVIIGLFETTLLSTCLVKADINMLTY